MLYMGRDAGRPYAEGARYNAVTDAPCAPEPSGPFVGGDEAETTHGCVALSDEFFQYWLGAYEYSAAGGSTTGSKIAPVDGIRAPFAGIGWTFADGGIAPGRNAAAYAASGEAIGAAYPEVAGRTVGRYRGARPDPSTGRTTTAAAIETPWSILFGFGFEDIAGAEQQARVMGRALQFLLAPR
jgi:hypothetical protein